VDETPSLSLSLILASQHVLAMSIGWIDLLERKNSYPFTIQSNNIVGESQEQTNGGSLTTTALQRPI
jgi:hypothetical protein